MGPKRHYGQWLKSKNPKLPRTSRHNLRHFEADAEHSDQDDDNGNITAREENAPAPSPTHLDQSSSSAAVDHASDVNMENPELTTSDPDTTRSDSEDVTSNNDTGDSDVSDDESMTSATVQEGNDQQSNQDIDDGEVLFRKPKKREELDLPIFPGLTTSKFDCYLMCLHFMMRHGLTSVALGDLLKLINCIFGEEVINQDARFLENLFKGSFDMQFHFYCPSCKAYVGDSSNFGKEQRHVECPNESCDSICKLNDSMNGGHFFIYIPMEGQLRSVLESHVNVWEVLNYRFTREVDENIISDIFDGSLYKKLAAEGGILSEVKNISVTCNSDGSPVFKSTHNSMWPIQFRLNELPVDQRFNKCNTMVAGIWFGKTDPEMSTFCTPFTKESVKLYRDGFNWTDPNGDNVISRVAVINCVLDSVGRPKMQGTKQFNGYYGCNFCYHPGVIVPEHRHPRYLINLECDMRLSENFEFLYEVTRKKPSVKDRRVLETFEVRDRTNEGTREEMKQLAAGIEQERGVQALSPFYPLQWFDLVHGFSVDYMHAVLIGVCKFVTNEFLDSANNEKEFYIGPNIAELNKRLLEISPPSSVSWYPRSLNERANWKANEWRMWLLFYSLICFQGILKPKYLKHHCLLVTAVYILLQNRITKEQLQSASRYLMIYVRDFQKHFGEKSMSFNVHLLLHLPRCVEKLGPLWCFSAFPFESGNGFLVRLVKGTKSVAAQIAKKYIMAACIPEMIPIYKVSESAVEYCSDIMSYYLAKVVRHVDDVTLLGLPTNIPLGREEENALQAAGLMLSPYTYERVIKNGVKYHALCYKRQGKKSNDSFLKLTNGEYVVLKRILVSTDNSLPVYALVRLVNVLRSSPVVTHSCGANAPHIRSCAPNIYGSMNVIDCKLIQHKVIKIDINVNGEEKCFVADMPKFLEKD